MIPFNSLAPGGFENIFQNVFFKLISWIDTLSNSCETALRSMPQNPSDDKSTLVQVMAWCRQAASHYLSQCCPRSLSPYGVTRPQWVKMILQWNTTMAMGEIKHRSIIELAKHASYLVHSCAGCTTHLWRDAWDCRGCAKCLQLNGEHRKPSARRGRVVRGTCQGHAHEVSERSCDQVMWPAGTWIKTIFEEQIFCKLGQSLSWNWHILFCP